MLSLLRGDIVTKTPTELELDVNGVGYHLTIPVSTFEKLQSANGRVTILTYLHVREDAMQLFGFATEQERDMFRMLISVSGIGPKSAQVILSGLRAEELRSAISQGNISALTSVPGIGKKTAERIVLELSDKIEKAPQAPAASSPSSKQLKSRSEALIALMSLGYTRSAAEQSLRIALSEVSGADPTVEEMVRLALRKAVR